MSLHNVAPTVESLDWLSNKISTNLEETIIQLDISMLLYDFGQVTSSLSFLLCKMKVSEQSWIPRGTWHWLAASQAVKRTLVDDPCRRLGPTLPWEGCLPSKGGSQLTLASQCESKNVMTSPVAAEAPSIRVLISPSRFLVRRILTLGKRAM